MFRQVAVMIMIVSMFLLGATVATYAADDLQQQVTDIKNVLPKFAIPMREVGDRFQNMYFAAKGDNWALAYYMSKYMNGAMNPAKLTKAAEYPVWKAFYDDTFAPINKAIYAKDFKTFEKEYTAVIAKCNDCHASMGYGFIKVVKMNSPADNGISYTGKSKAEDVPK
jgi:hypothetical protein